MNVQKNFFTWYELTTTNTGLPNNPTSPFHLDNLAKLWRYLNFIREKIGAPIFINSAFRTPAVNKQVGGAECSYHLQGLAADIRTLPSHRVQLGELLTLHYDRGYISEFIVHETFFHIAI